MLIISRLSKVLFFLIFFASFQAFAQNSISVQIEDYVILQNGRRFDGTVLRKLGQMDFEKIEFLRRGETEIYYPGDIQSFGLGTGELYKSILLEGVESKQFVQILVDGPVDLARYRGVYFAGNEADLKRLEEKASPEKNNPVPTSSRYIPYISTLNTLMAGDCQGRIYPLIQRTKLREDELLWLFTRYYECEKSEAVFFTELQPPFRISPVVLISSFQTGIKKDQVYGDRKDVISSSMILQGYLGLKLHSFRNSPRFSIEFGAAYETSNLTWESQLESGTGSFTAKEDINLSFLSFPLSFNYILKQSMNKDYFIGLGTGYGFSTSNSEFSIQDILYRGFDYMVLEEGSFVNVKKGVVYFQGHGGIQFKLKSKKELSLMGRFRYMPTYYNVELSNNEGRYHKLDLGIGLGILF